MKRSLAVLRSAGLTLGLLFVLGGSARAQVMCPEPMTGSHDFGGVAIGNSSGPVGVFGCAGACPATQFTIIGPNAIEFSATVTGCTGGVSCSAQVAFTPLGCGTRTATLVATTLEPVNINGVLFPAGCVTDRITLIGFGCSFDCAINATQNAGLSPTVRDRILRELFAAQAATGATRCSRLNCALCIALPEAQRGRAGAQDIVDQIRCLLLVNACPPAF